ncbi:gas vesicle protein [Plantactinospora siamensis]|uniref:Gas vesicle protein n=1 Tax=Plantactinospora siamensis TaxID=555372 RepID=A0ABV6NUE6_9ACTN
MTAALPLDARGPEPFAAIALVDLLDRVLATGVVVTGELVLSIAEVDLVYVSLRALVSSVRPGIGIPDVTQP